MTELERMLQENMEAQEEARKAMRQLIMLLATSQLICIRTKILMENPYIVLSDKIYWN